MVAQHIPSVGILGIAFVFPPRYSLLFGKGSNFLSPSPQQRAHLAGKKGRNSFYAVYAGSPHQIQPKGFQ
jgi:hypothetical protein